MLTILSQNVLAGVIFRIDLVKWKTTNNNANPQAADVPTSIFAPYDPADFKIIKTKWYTLRNTA